MAKCLLLGSEKTEFRSSLLRSLGFGASLWFYELGPVLVTLVTQCTGEHC